MVRAKQIEAGSIGHGCGDGNDLVVHVRQLDHGLAKNFGVGLLRGGFGLSRGRIIRSKPVKLLLLRQGWFKALAFLRERM